MNENTLSIMNETEVLAEFILKEPMKFMNNLALSYNLTQVSDLEFKPFEHTL